MDKLGYGLAWRVLDAQFFGVAQRRRRLFLVGRLGACPPVEVLIEPESLRGDYPSSREKRKALAEAAGRGARCAGIDTNLSDTGCLNPDDPQSKRVFTADSCAPTLSSGTSEGISIQPSVLVPKNQVVCMADTQANTRYGVDACGTLTSHETNDAQVFDYGYGRHNVVCLGDDNAV